MISELADELCAAGFERMETHISYVFLRDSDVYKVKRAVSLGFLDFSTLELRERACIAECELNGRLSHDVYHGVVAIVRAASGELAFIPREALSCREKLLDWAVHMRRLSEADRADRLLTDDTLTWRDMERLARVIAAFHGSARADDTTASYGLPEVIEQNVLENFTQLAPMVGEYLTAGEHEALVSFQTGFLARESGPLRRRASAGFVRDGHGDLRLEHCYRTKSGSFLVIDCIEFNDRFRYADVCADLAFLAMDLAHHGRQDLADAFGLS